MFLELPSTSPAGRRIRLAPLLLTCLTAAAGAQEADRGGREAVDSAPAPAAPVPFDPRQVLGDPFEQLLFDRPGDGTLWVRGRTYKAVFDGSSATVHPDLGAEAPRNYPVRFELAAVGRGSGLLPVLASPEVELLDQVVRMDHGPCASEYVLELESLEQRFVLPELPEGSGDLVLRLRLETELAASVTDRGLRFACEHGALEYGEAFALDAGGRKVPMGTRLEDGAIELRLAEGSLSALSLPLVVDPLITTLAISTSSGDQRSPDVAYDVTTDRWCVVYQRPFSAFESDVYAGLVTGAGVLVGTVPVDITAANWITPAVANSNLADNFLVAATEVTANAMGSIRGRLLFPATSSTGPILGISTTGGGRGFPDVGGDPWPGLSYYAVVWQRDLGPSDSDIELQSLWPNTGALSGSPIVLAGGPSRDQRPSIGNSAGIDIADNQSGWTVVWEHLAATADRDIHGARIHWTGEVQIPAFPIQTSGWDESAPSVSSSLDPLQFDGPRPCLVVYERDYGTDRDLFASVLEGSTLLYDANISVWSAPDSWARDQRAPSVDSDGEQFFVAFEERATPGASAVDLYASSFRWLSGGLVPCELRANLANQGSAETEVAVYAMASGAGPKGRFLAAWQRTSMFFGLDVLAGLWDGCGGGPVGTYCVADGSAYPCPCGNAGDAGHGCANSANVAGALLGHAGSASVGTDTLVLEASGLPPSAPCLFYQANRATLAIPFGDGLRCTGGAIVRFPVVSSSNGIARYPGTGNPGIAVLGQVAPGQTVYYQAWYRDAAPFCTSAPFNLTGALYATWLP